MEQRSDLIQFVGERIRELRSSFGGPGGISQDALAKAIQVATNTVSRWETGTYRPNLDDLERLARFLGVSILEFFPKNDEPAEQRVAALLRAAHGLSTEDLEELRKYAEFRKARSLLTGDGPKKKAGRPRRGSS